MEEVLGDFFLNMFTESMDKCMSYMFTDSNETVEYDEEEEPLVTPEVCSIIFDILDDSDESGEIDISNDTTTIFDNSTIETTTLSPEERYGSAFVILGNTYGYTYQWILLIACILNVFAMFVQRRKRLCKNCCWGYFGIVFPVNFLESRRHRLTILSAFILTTSEVLTSILEPVEEPNSFLQVILKIYTVLKTTMSCSPILTCFTVDTYPTLILGIAYTLLYTVPSTFSAYLTQVVSEGELGTAQMVGLLVSEAIVVVSGLLVLVGYIRRIYQKCRGKQQTETITHRYQRIYMQKLLCKKSDCNSDANPDVSDALLGNKNRPINEEKPQNKCLACWKSKVYASTPGFRYGLSLLVSLTVGITALSFVITKFLARFISFRYFILYDVLQNKTLKKILGKIPLPNLLKAVVKKVFKATHLVDTEWKISAYQLIYDQFEVFLTCICVIIGLVYIIMYYTSMNILRSYKENILSLHQRKRDSHMLKIKTMSNVYLVVYAVQYAGYQVAYLLWGAFLQILVFTAMLIILCEVIFLPIKYGSWSVVRAIAEWIAPILVTMIITKGTQWLLVRFCFLQDGGKVLALDNRRGFYMMMYFMFYYNIFMGIFSCIVRIVKAALFGLYFLTRLDRSIFPRTFEHLDAGFKSYTCLMKLEAMQSNVIVTCFANILLKKEPFDGSPGVKELAFSALANIESNIFEQKSADPELKRRRNIARNRWHLAYTLWNNPELILIRGHQNRFVEENIKITECESTV